MYELRRISLMNWNVFDIEDIELSGTTALIGSVGVGKSTILDALQTVLSGNQRSRISLNRAASVQKSRRTVKEYCLGYTEETIAQGLVRTHCHSILALSFFDPELNRSYSMGLVLYAEEDKQHEETLMRWVAPGVDFSFPRYADRDDEGNLTIHDALQVIERVKQDAGQHFQTHNAVARGFIEAYLRGMRGSGAMAPDVNTVLSRFRKAIAFEEIQDTTKFVREFVLDEDPINADRLRDGLKQWDDISAQLEATKLRLKNVKEIRRQYRNWGRHLSLSLLADLRMNWHEKRRYEIRSSQITEQISKHEYALSDLERDQRRIESRIIEEETQRERKMEKERALKTNTERELATIRYNTSREKTRGLRNSTASMLRIHAKMSTVADLDSIDPSERKKIISASERLKDASDKIGDQTSPVTKRDIKEIEADLIATRHAIRHLKELQGTTDGDRDRLRELTAEKKDLKDLLSRFSEGYAILSKEADELVELLLSKDIEVHTLPDQVEVKDDQLEWAPAVEAMLGAYRETIFVPQRHLFDALRAQNTLSHKGAWNVKIAAYPVQTTKDVPDVFLSESAISILETEDQDVRALLHENFGHVYTADSKEAFKDPGNYLLSNGMRRVGGAYAHGVPSDLVLGEAARNRRVASAEARLAEIEMEIPEVEARIASGRQMADAIMAVENVTDAEAVEALYEVLRSIDELAAARTTYESTTSPEAQALRAEIDEHKDQIDALRRELQDKILPKISNTREVKVAHERDLQHISEKLDEADNAVKLLVEQDAKDPFKTYRRGFAHMEANAESDGVEHHGEDELNDRRYTLRNMTAAREIELLKDADQPNTEYHEELFKQAKASKSKLTATEERERAYTKSFHRWAEAVKLPEYLLQLSDPEIFLWVCQHADELENDAILKFTKEIDEKFEEVRKAAYEMLVVGLQDKFERTKSAIQSLNQRLRAHKFEGLTYLFTWSVDPEMRPLYDLSRHIYKDASKSVVALEADDNPAMQEAIETIKAIFSSDASTERFEDYRKYFRFEIRMTADEVSEDQIKGQTIEGFEQSPNFIGNLTDRIAKGSGGQKQTPYYVAIAASMAAAYFPKSKSHADRGMGLVCFDEAFSKLDIRNTQALIRFFHSLNLQILVAAPEEKRTSFMELTDTIVDLYKEPGIPKLYVDSKTIRERARAQLIETNPERVGLDGYRERMNEGQLMQVGE